MKGTTRKHSWPVSLATMIAVVGMLAAFVALAALPGVTSAQAPPPPPPPPGAGSPDPGTPGDLPVPPAPPPPTPDPNQAPTLTGTPLADVLQRIEGWSEPIDVSVAFTDPDEDDKLTYSATSNKTNIAIVRIDGNMLFIRSDGAGSATITVTATDGDGATVSTTMKVEVEHHASQPEMFGLEGLDNGARLNWRQPKLRARGASVIGYRIHRDAWTSTPNHPINTHGDATIDLLNLPSVLAADYNDRGLAYDTVYSYKVLAIVEYDVRHWWNNLPAATKLKITLIEKNYGSLNDAEKAAVHYNYNLQAGKYPVSMADAWWDDLNCAQRNDAVSPGNGEPQVGSDAPLAIPRSPYCHMYDELSPAAVEVVDRAHGNSHFRYGFGAETGAQSITTGTSGGLLDALLAPPSAPRDVSADHSCDDQIMVAWKAPVDNGKVPANAPGCSTCTNQTPKHTGGDGAGIEVQPGTAVITGYIVERKIDDGLWQTLASNVTGLSYVDDSEDVQYGATYHYRVKAVNNANLAGPVGMVSLLLDEPPAARVPQSPDADLHAEDSSKVLFTWDPPPGAWRSVEDIGDDNQSKSMMYHVQRRLEGTTDWVPLTDEDEPQVHQYLDNVSKEDAIRNIQTQGHEDEPKESGSYKYRVAALLHSCQLSEWAVTAQEVVVNLEMGNASGLSAVAGPVPGVVNLNWTPAPNASVHWLAGIKQSDWDAGDYSNITWTQTQGSSAHVLTGLDSGAQYAFTVIGGESVNGPWGSWTALVRVTPN